MTPGLRIRSSGAGTGLFAQISSSDEKLISPLVREELRLQAGYAGIPDDAGGRLGEVRTRLRALTRLGKRPGRTCVPDTNALPHYTRFDQLPSADRLQMVHVGNAFWSPRFPGRAAWCLRSDAQAGRQHRRHAYLPRHAKAGRFLSRGGQHRRTKPRA